MWIMFRKKGNHIRFIGQRSEWKWKKRCAAKAYRVHGESNRLCIECSHKYNVLMYYSSQPTISTASAQTVGRKSKTSMTTASTSKMYIRCKHLTMRTSHSNPIAMSMNCRWQGMRKWIRSRRYLSYRQQSLSNTTHQSIFPGASWKWNR